MSINKNEQERGPESKRGSKKRTRQNDPLFHGVRKRKWGRFVSEIRMPGQKTRIWLGSFVSPEMAARAYDSAAFFLKGNSACLNFPDSVGLLPQPVSNSRRDIQLAAAKAAVEHPKVGGIEQVKKASGGDPGCLEWWDDLGTLPIEEVKEWPLILGEDQDTWSFLEDNDLVLSSCSFEL